MNHEVPESQPDSIQRARSEAEAAHLRVDRQLSVVSRAGEQALQSAWSSTRVAVVGAAMIGGALATAAIIFAVRQQSRPRLLIKPVTHVERPKSRPLLRALGRALLAGVARAALQRLATGMQERMSQASRN